MNKFLILLTILVLSGAGYFYFTTAKPMSSTPVEPSITWQLSTAGEVDGIPKTDVAVTINSVSRKIATFNGSCSEIGESGGVDGKGLLAGELSAVQCWYAGGGNEIGVFAVEDGTIQIMVGVLGELEDGEGVFRGDFSVLE